MCRLWTLSVVFYETFWVQGSSGRIGRWVWERSSEPEGRWTSVNNAQRLGLTISLGMGLSGVRQHFWGRGCVAGGAFLGTGQLGTSQGAGP